MSLPVVVMWNAKLTEQDVIDIRGRSPQILYAKLSAEYGVHLMTNAHVITRKTWKHL